MNSSLKSTFLGKNIDSKKIDKLLVQNSQSEEYIYSSLRDSSSDGIYSSNLNIQDDIDNSTINSTKESLDFAKCYSV